MRIEHRFVDSFPPISEMEPGVLYVSMKYRSAAHLCACGCRGEVVTPIRKGAWRFCFDGESVTLSPSVGSRNLACKSHYFIRDGEILWAPDWMDEPDVTQTQSPNSVEADEPRRTFWSYVRGLFGL